MKVNHNSIVRIIVLILTIMMYSCEYPPEHIFGLHNHKARIDITNYYADGELLIRDYHIETYEKVFYIKCDTCPLVMIFDNIRKNQELLYGDQAYLIFEVPRDFAIKLTPYDILLSDSIWIVHVGTGNKNKHTELILEP